MAEEQKRAESVALEEVAKMKAEVPVTSTTASRATEQSRAVVPFNKDLAQKGQQQQQTQTASKPRKANKKVLKVLSSCEHSFHN